MGAVLGGNPERAAKVSSQLGRQRHGKRDEPSCSQTPGFPDYLMDKRALNNRLQHEGVCHGHVLRGIRLTLKAHGNMT